MEIVKKYSDSRFRIITHITNEGTGISRNDGIYGANGKYISFLDPDDWLEPDYLESLKGAFEANPDINWVMFKYQEHSDPKLEVARVSVPPKYFSYPSGIEKITPESLKDYTIFCWAKAYRLDWLKERKICYAETTYEETLFYFHCVFEEQPVYLIDKTLYNYLVRPDSWTTSTDAGAIRKNIKSAEYLLNYVPKMIVKRRYNTDFITPCKNILWRFYSYQFGRFTVLK